MHQAERAKVLATKLQGRDGFDKYYASLYKERWQLLKQSLLEEPVSCPFDAGGDSPYYLDLASIIAAKTLPLSEATSILDMCAAPGGKTLILASSMPNSAKLTCCDRSADRVKRLEKVCVDCLPTTIRKSINIICTDSARLCQKFPCNYDAILLDAPCSSERHVITSDRDISKWSESRIKQVTTLQWSLLSSAYKMLKQAGFLLYSTCSINIAENDNLVERLLSRYNDINVCKNYATSDFAQYGKVSVIEKTLYGNMIMPDVNDGAGPMFFCLLQKDA